MKKTALVLFLLISVSFLFASSFTVSSSTFIKYPESWNSLSSEEKQVRVLNVLTSISTQKGITYISKTAGNKEKVLFEDSFCIKSPSDENPIADPTCSSCPSRLTLFSIQKDNRFGANKYKLNYSCLGDEILLSIINIDALKFHGYTCVEKGKLDLKINARLTSEGIEVLTSAVVKDREPSLKVLFFTIDLEESFYNRVDSLQNWFVSQIE